LQADADSVAFIVCELNACLFQKADVGGSGKLSLAPA
jgi:hypothetical protein